MQFNILTSLALFVASAVAQSSNANPFNIPNGGYQLTAGQASTITWKPTTSGPVTLKLREGANSALTQGTVIAQSIPNSGSFFYTPPTNTVRNSDYTIEISSDSDSSAVNYTPQFVIESSNTVASISASSSAASVTSAASSSASASSASSASNASSSAASSASASSTAASSSSTASSKSGSSSSASSAGATSTSGTSTTASLEKAPSSGANVKNVMNGGLAAIAVGAAFVL